MKKFQQPDFDIHTFTVSDIITASSDPTEDDCEDGWDTPWKPVIYLYPEEETKVSVKLDVEGQLGCTYPAYKDGWFVTAKPDGTIIDEKGRSYYCLFWDGAGPQKYDMSKGFVIKGADTAEFLEKTLQHLGLNEKEANEFIIFWLPRMEQNPYNLISFQTTEYEQKAKLEIIPKPDSILRVFMTFKPLDKPVKVEPQSLETFERKGFTAIEWGGLIVSD